MLVQIHIVQAVINLFRHSYFVRFGEDADQFVVRYSRLSHDRLNDSLRSVAVAARSSAANDIRQFHQPALKSSDFAIAFVFDKVCGSDGNRTRFCSLCARRAVLSLSHLRSVCRSFPAVRAFRVICPMESSVLFRFATAICQRVIPAPSSPYLYSDSSSKKGVCGWPGTRTPVLISKQQPIFPISLSFPVATRTDYFIGRLLSV